MKNKHILTRNYLNKTNAKYCLLKFGDKPEDAKEVDSIYFNSCKFISAYSSDICASRD